MGTIPVTTAEVLKRSRRSAYIASYNHKTTAGVHVMTPQQLRVLMEACYDAGYVDCQADVAGAAGPPRRANAARRD